MYYLFSFSIFLLSNTYELFHYQTIHYSWHIIRILNNYLSSKIQRIQIRIVLFRTNYSNIRIIWIIRPNTLDSKDMMHHIWLTPRRYIRSGVFWKFIIHQKLHISHQSSLTHHPFVIWNPSSVICHLSSGISWQYICSLLIFAQSYLSLTLKISIFSSYYDQNSLNIVWRVVPLIMVP